MPSAVSWDCRQRQAVSPLNLLFNRSASICVCPFIVIQRDCRRTVSTHRKHCVRMLTRLCVVVMLVITLRLYFFCKYISDIEGCRPMSRLKKKVNIPRLWLLIVHHCSSEKLSAFRGECENFWLLSIGWIFSTNLMARESKLDIWVFIVL